MDGVAKLVFVSVVIEADDSPAPSLWSFLLWSPLPPPLVLGNSFSNFLHSILPNLWMSAPFLLRHSYYSWSRSQEGCTCHRLPLLSQRIDCLAGLCHVFTFNFISKQIKIEIKKTPCGEKSPRCKVSKKNFRFDESTVPKMRPLGFKCQYNFLTRIVVSELSIIFFDEVLLFTFFS